MTLTVRNLNVVYGSRVVVADVDLEVSRGEIVAVLGASGSGKSSLLRAICGLIPYDGSVSWGSCSLDSTAAHNRQIGLMFQDHALFEHMSVADNVGFGLKMRGVSRRDRVAQVMRWLGLVGLAGFESRRISSLSGGEQQRVALARSMAPAPRALLLDEPFGALDPTLRARLAAELRDLVHHHSIAAILVTHDHSEAFMIADRIAVLIGGRIAQLGSPIEVWSRPESTAVCEALGFGTAIRATAHEGVIDCGWMTVAAPEHLEHVRDRCVDVVFRPDAFSIDAQGLCTAIVRSIAPYRDRSQAAIQVGGGPMVYVDSAPNLRVGDVVRIAVNPESVLCYWGGSM